jgi:hypothetical protein
MLEQGGLRLPFLTGKIMTQETIKILYGVQDKLKEIRKDLDRYMYYSGPRPDEDVDYCRKVYDAVCKVMDLL